MTGVSSTIEVYNPNIFIYSLPPETNGTHQTAFGNYILSILNFNALLRELWRIDQHPDAILLRLKARVTLMRRLCIILKLGFVYV